MNAGVVATRYAKAIYEFALEKGEESVVYESLGLLAGNFSRLPELSSALKDPTISAQQKSEVLLTACGNTKSETLRKVIHLVLKNDRVDYMENIALVYGEQYRKSKGIVIAHLTSVEPAGEKMKKELVDIISKITQDQVEFHTQTDPDIIGGFILEIENNRLDASVRDQLNRLRLDLIN